MGGLPTNRPVNGFAANHNDRKIMLVAMRDGLFRSNDAGQTWQPVTSKLTNLSAVTFNSKKSSEAFLSTIDGTIYMSADDGMNWKKP